MSDDELKSFEVSCKIGLANSADYLGRCIPKMGKIEFNAKAKKFSTRDPFQIELSVENLAQLGRKDCVNGKSMIIGFNKPSFKYNQLLLADLSEGDKQLIHKCLLKLVGVGTGRVNKPASGGNKRPYPIQAANQSNSANLTFTAASKTTTTIPKSPSIIGPPNNFSNITTRRKVAVAPTIVRSSPSMIDVHQNNLNASRTTTKVAPTIARISPSMIDVSRTTTKVTPTTPKSSIFGHQSSFITTRKPAPKTIPESPKMDMDYDLQNNFEVPRTSMDDYSEMEKQPSKSPELNNKENYHLVRPEDELELPEKYKLDDFWAKLKMDEQIRSGMRGEWIKGQDEHLTVEGLLCLKDGQWLNADMMDAYLSFTAKRIDRVRYIPTYAILSYNRTKKIPSEWYWPLRDADMVLVPTHLNNNHWAMAVVDIPGRKIQMMDSMNNGFIGETKRKFMETIMDILFAVAEQQKEEEYLGERWRWDREELLEVPQQMNGTDCGIFALLFGRFAAERKPFPYNFSQQNIPYYRRRFCYDIVHTIQ